MRGLSITPIYIFKNGSCSKITGILGECGISTQIVLDFKSTYKIDQRTELKCFFCCSWLVGCFLSLKKHNL